MVRSNPNRRKSPRASRRPWCGVCCNSSPNSTYIGNEWFAWFASTDSKSRGNFLELLQVERRYEVNAEALAYMAERGLAAGHREMLAARPVVMTDPKDWAAHLRRNLVGSRRAVALATEGALIGGLVAQGFNLEMGLLSDDAGQFDRFVHGLLGPCRTAVATPATPERVGPAGHRRGPGADMGTVSGPKNLPAGPRPRC